jgi:hypothetical protein
VRLVRSSGWRNWPEVDEPFLEWKLRARNSPQRCRLEPIACSGALGRLRKAPGRRNPSAGRAPGDNAATGRGLHCPSVLGVSTDTPTILLTAEYARHPGEMRHFVPVKDLQGTVSVRSHRSWRARVSSPALSGPACAPCQVLFRFAQGARVLDLIGLERAGSHHRGTSQGRTTHEHHGGQPHPAVCVHESA